MLTTLFEETEEGKRSSEDERAMKGIASVLYAGAVSRQFAYVVYLTLFNAAGTDTVSAGRLD